MNIIFNYLEIVVVSKVDLSLNVLKDIKKNFKK